jgi:hypothetical protein
VNQEKNYKKYLPALPGCGPRYGKYPTPSQVLGLTADKTGFPDTGEKIIYSDSAR